MGIDMVNIRNISASDLRTVCIGVIRYRLGYIGINRPWVEAVGR